jgi:hypothetical protein
MITSGEILRVPIMTNNSLRILSIALVACGGTGSDDSPPGVPPSCDVAPDRIDPAAARGFTNDQFAALGAARTGATGRPTSQSNTNRRYVSANTGDDAADGSEAAPWRTLQHAADSVEPGTTVLVEPGDYAGGLQILRGGEPGAYVIFAARDPGAMPRILGDAGVDSVVHVDASYVVFQGFEVTSHRRASLSDDSIGIQIEPGSGDISHVEIRNNIVHDIGPGQLEQASCVYQGHGIIAQSEGHRISDLIIAGNEIHDVYAGHSEILVVNGNVDGFCVTENYIHDVNNIAIDIIGYEKVADETTRRGVIADNVVLDASNYWPYCTRGNCTYPAGDESSDGIYVDGGADIVIEYNVVGRADHGIELQSENGELIRNVEVRYNVVFNSNYRHFTLGPNEGSSEHDNQFFDDPALASAELESCR